MEGGEDIVFLDNSRTDMSANSVEDVIQLI